MKNRNIFLILALIILPFGVGFYYFQRSQAHYDHRVAIFYPASHPAMDEIEQGIKETFAKKGEASYLFDVYNANGNKTLLQSQAHEILRKQYSAIMTIGVGCTQTIYELGRKKGNTTPLIFNAVDDPVSLGFVKSLKSSGNHVTGSIVDDQFDKTFDVLKELKPEVKAVLFVYDPTQGTRMESVKNDINKELSRRKIALKTVEVFQPSEIAQKVPSMLDEVDTVFVYADHTIVSGIDSLVTLCNRYGKTLFSSTLSVGPSGVALCYGVREYDHGVNAALKAIEIIENKKMPSEVPVTPVEKMTIMVNTKTMGKQGIPLSQSKLQKIKIEGGIIL